MKTIEKLLGLLLISVTVSIGACMALHSVNGNINNSGDLLSNQPQYGSLAVNLILEGDVTLSQTGYGGNWEINDYEIMHNLGYVPMVMGGVYDVNGNYFTPFGTLGYKDAVSGDTYMKDPYAGYTCKITRMEDDRVHITVISDFSGGTAPTIKYKIYLLKDILGQ